MTPRASSSEPAVAPMKSLAIRIMPSHAARSENETRSEASSVASQACAVDAGHPATAESSEASRVSTMKWREGAERQAFRRCCWSTTSVVCRLVAFLVAVSCAAVWVPSSVLASKELRVASEDQLSSSVEQVSKEILGYLQVASTHAAVFGSMYNMSFVGAPEAAPARFMSEFGPGAWSLLKQSPALQSILLAQVRKPSNESVDDGSLDDESCDMDVALLASTYKSDLNSETTDIGLVGENNQASCATSFPDRFSEAACRAKAEQLGLTLGGGGQQFAGEWNSITGCYFYGSGSLKGAAFYGYASGGAEVQNASELTDIPPQAEMYRLDTCLPDDAAPPGMARMNNIEGDADLMDPLEYKSVKFFKRCSDWLGNRRNIWEMQNLPGNWRDMDSGVRQATWLPGTVVAGSGASQALYKKVFFPVEGPSWANQSAFGALSIRVGSRSIGGADDSVSMLEILRRVAAQTETMLFALTAEGELLASSVEGQEVELTDATGIVGLIPGDSELVKGPIQPVARQLIEAHCTLDSEGQRSCDWAAAVSSQERQMHGYYTASKLVVDSHATGLGLLLVNMVSVEEISLPAKQLNEQLLLTSGFIFVAACLYGLVLGRTVSLPFRRARDSMFLLGDMKVEQALRLNDPGQGSSWRFSFTEVSDLRLSFYHAATCLKAWSDHEMENRRHLEEERENRINKTVEKAVRGAGKLVHPMVLISADAFSKLEQLTSYEELRNTGKLVYLDTEDSLATFKADSSIIFLSHQWLAWGFPDNATKTHLNAMKSAVRSASQRVGAASNDARCAWENTYVWVDYCSIAQEHRGMQMLAVSSLPVYASSADIFVIVAPPAEHQCNTRCDLQTYNARGWCRAEMLAKVCSSGLDNFFIFAGEGGLEPVTEQRLPSLSMYVFEGDFSCCQQKHIKSSCDKEALVEPVLGLYALVLRQVRAGVNLQHMQPILKHIADNKDRFFPPTHRYLTDGAMAEERELFGPLVESTESFVQELSLAECAFSFQSAANSSVQSKATAASSI